MQRITIFIFMAVLMAVCSVLHAQDDNSTNPISPEITVSQDHDLGLSQRLGDIEIQKTGDEYLLTVKTKSGLQTLTPDQFAAQLHDQQSRSNWVFSVMNITTWAGISWVALGLVGQILFTGRMIVQWLVSEKNKRSVVPVAFWWMSVTGATMLLVYFIWRRDIVGVIGQATGWFIYVRNLRFIYSSKYGGKDRKQESSIPAEASD